MALRLLPHFLLDAYALLHSAPNLTSLVIDHCSSQLEAHGLILRLSQSLLKTSPSQPMANSIPALEIMIGERAPTINDALNKPGATINTAVEELIKEHTVGELSAKEGGGKDDPGEDQAPRGDAIEAALRAESFKRVVNALKGADTATKVGKMDAIAAGFSGDCTLAVRTLCRPLRAATVTGRVAALATLSDLHPHVHTYLTWILTADPNTGQVPRHLQGYSIVGELGADEKPTGEGKEFLDKLLSFDLANIDWIYSPGGLLTYKHYTDAGTQMFSSAGPSSSKSLEEDIHPLDIYTRVEVVEELGPFIHRLLTALGCAHSDQGDIPRNGMTFLQWNSVYIEHLKRAAKLPTVEERYGHLEHCHGLYRKALARAGAFLRGEVYSLLPATRSIDRGVLRNDEEPMTSLVERQAAHNRLIALRTEYSGFLVRTGDTMVPAQAFSTLRRSTNPALQHEARAAEEDRRKGRRGMKRKRNEPSSSTSEGKAKEGAPAPHAQQSQQVVPTPPTPGSQVASYTWIKPNVELYISGYVWRVDELAKLARVPVISKCWPWLLSTRRDANKPALCDKWSKPGHSSATDAAHILPGVLDLVRLGADKKYCRLPTTQERDAQYNKAAAAGVLYNSRGRGKGKGAPRAAGRGKAGRGGEQPPSTGAALVA